MELTKKTIGQYLREQTAVIGDHTAMEMFGWSCSFAQPERGASRKQRTDTCQHTFDLRHQL